jgi:SPP1 gp7 family putative phage head morphogenesis protein
VGRVTKQQIKRVLDPDWVRAADVPHLGLRYAETLIKRLIMTLEARAVEEQARLYTRTYQTIRTRAQNSAERLNVNTASSDRMTAIWRAEVNEALEEELPRLTQSLQRTGLRYAAAAYVLGYYGQAWELDVNTVSEFRPNAPTPPPAQLIDLLSSAQPVSQDAYAEMIYQLLGVDWRDFYAPEMDILLPQLRAQVLQGTSQGESIPDIMRRLRETMGISTDRRRGYRANFNRVQTITRTTVNQVSNDGAYSIFQQNADVLSGYQWIVARDERLCPSCLEKANRVYNINDVERPPLHPNCRCTIIPVIDPNWLTNATEPPRQSFGAWLEDSGASAFLAGFMAAGRSGRIG